MTETEKEKAISLYSKIESDLQNADLGTGLAKRGLVRRTADKMLGVAVRRISDADPFKAARKVRELKEKHPLATDDQIVELLIKAKCQKAGTVGAVTSVANVIPGIGTALSLTIGMAVDIGSTLKLQAELVLEIAEARGAVLSDAQRNEVVLVVAGISAGSQQAGGKALQRLSQKAGEMAAQKWMSKALPAIGVAAAAGTNVVSTYIIGKRADVYFRHGPTAMGDWKENLRALSGVDERKITNWISESSNTLAGKTAIAGKAVRHAMDKLSKRQNIFSKKEEKAVVK